MLSRLVLTFLLNAAWQLALMAADAGDRPEPLSGRV